MSPTHTPHWNRMAALHQLRALVRDGLVRLRPTLPRYCFTHDRQCRCCDACGNSSSYFDVDLVSSEAPPNEVP